MDSIKSITDRFQRVKDLNVLVVGDIILDEYIYGTIERKSAEAPINIVDQKKTKYVLGGSANVVANLRSLGAQAYMVGLIGNDIQGKEISNQLSKIIDAQSIIRTDDRCSTTKTRVIVDGEQIFRMDNENRSPINTPLENKILDAIKSLINVQTLDGIILQDYNKGLFTPRVILETINMAKAHQIEIFVDPKFDNFLNYQSVDYFKPNKKELLEACSDYRIELKDAISEIYHKINCTHIVCTLAEGGIAHQSNNKLTIAPTKKIENADVSGAGDSTMAMLCLAALLDYHIEDILRLCNAAGRSACLKEGVAVITLADVLQNL